MKFVLRVDDLGWRQNGQKDEGLRLARKMHQILAGMPYVGAIIPAALDEEGRQWLQTRPENLTPAVHGWNHARAMDGVASEFRLCGPARCRKLIAEGMNAIGRPIEHLVLPFNAWEHQLGEAAYLEGIRWIWGGGLHDTTSPSDWPTPPQPYSIGRLGFIPSWRPTYGAVLWNMGPGDRPIKENLARVRQLPGKCVLTLHITWEASREKELEGIEWLVKQIANDVISASEFLRN